MKQPIRTGFGSKPMNVPRGVFPRFEIGDETKRNRLEQLSAYEAPFVEKSLIAEGLFSSPIEYAEAWLEFKRFVALYMIYEKPMGMISPHVDAVWHRFILYTREYTIFCREIVGEYMHHIPCGPSDGGDKEILERDCEAFRSAYRDAFGEMPQVIQACCSGNCDSGGTT